MSAVLSTINLCFILTLLSIDNALVLGVTLTRMPSNHSRLRFKAVYVGFGGAVVCRLIALSAASFLLEHRIVQASGALYLIYLSCDYLCDSKCNNQVNEQHFSKGFWASVTALVLTDLSFSLDNIVAAVSFTNSTPVVWAATFLSIAVTFACLNWLLAFLDKHPILETVAYLLIAVVAVETLANLAHPLHISDMIKFVVTAALISGAFVYERSPKIRAALRPIIAIVTSLARAVSFITSLAFRPVVQTGKIMWKVLSEIF